MTGKFFPIGLPGATLAGALLALMLLASIGHGLFPAVPEWIAGLAAWSSALFLLKRLSSGQRRQCMLLIVVGIAGLAVGISSEISIDFERILDENQAILALIAGVSFVHMASAPVRSEDATVPRGPAAFLRTLLGLNLLAAAINITALMLVSERVANARPLGPVEASAFSRVFSLAVLYSPFIGGMALALNQAPQASLANVAAVGIGLTLCGIGFTYLSALWLRSKTLEDFPGYPLRPDVLWLPAALAVAVFGLHAYRPQVPVLTAIALLAPVIALLGVGYRIGAARAGSRFVAHVATRLPGMSGELWLFLSAGVLSVGLSSAFAAFGLSLPDVPFPGVGASVVLLSVLLLAAAGLHPIITLSALVPLLEPLHLTQEGTVLLYVVGWSVGCALCPYSGTNLILQARHGLTPWRFPLWSAGYALFMWALASAALTFEAGLG